MKNVNSQCADEINKYWRALGYDPETRVEMTTVTTVADEMTPQVDQDGNFLRDNKGKIIKIFTANVKRTTTLPVVVSNMIDAYPTKSWK